MSSSFFTHPAPTDIYPLPLHDALPIYPATGIGPRMLTARQLYFEAVKVGDELPRSEEHTSELQSPLQILCLLLFLLIRRPPISTLFPYTTLFLSILRRG